ncbi:hypothetical protein FA95DRAFT_1607502 [Auriscalpium vulgare]|uniref:Uncharacterized protein n=1 Tax=Auriscalpium vulgare TaxID=40419 RepID=A0ACB8RPD0_9AGAM|nr:hypothetical protein FA95DRAFT_1607502 [Auriscalpium vulgare]
MLGPDLNDKVMKACHMALAGKLSPHWLPQMYMAFGAAYFFILFVIDSANTLGILLAPPLIKGAFTLLTNVLSATMTSRLMINLRVENDRIHKCVVAQPVAPKKPRVIGAGSTSSV